MLQVLELPQKPLKLWQSARVTGQSSLMFNLVNHKYLFLKLFFLWIPKINEDSITRYQCLTQTFVYPKGRGSLGGSGRVRAGGAGRGASAPLPQPRCLSPRISVCSTPFLPQLSPPEHIYIYGKSLHVCACLPTGKYFVLSVGSPQRMVWGQSRALGARRLRSEGTVATRRDRGSWP